jgi:hypothetical protein
MPRESGDDLTSGPDITGGPRLGDKALNPRERDHNKITLPIRS